MYRSKHLLQWNMHSVYSKIMSKNCSYPSCSFRIPMDLTRVSVMLATQDSTVTRRLMSVNQTPVQMAELAL